MQRWKKKGETTQKVGYKWIVHKEFVMPDAAEEIFTTWGRPGTQNIATIAITEDGKVVVAHQFRPGPERMFYELPGGGVEEGEGLAEAAARELLEETGYSSDEQFEYLGAAFRDAYTNETNNYFLARNCKLRGMQKLDATEHVAVQLISIGQLIANAKTAKMSDSVGVLMAYDQLKKLQEKVHA